MGNVANCYIKMHQHVSESQHFLHLWHANMAYEYSYSVWIGSLSVDFHFNLCFLFLSTHKDLCFCVCTNVCMCLVLIWTQMSKESIHESIYGEKRFSHSLL